MANRITKTPTFRPGHYAAKLAKALEDEAKAKNRSRHKDAAGCESKSSGSIQMGPESHNGSKVIHQSDRETELVDSSPDRLHQSTTHANNRPSEQVKQGPFKALSERAKQMERGREWESNAAKRLLKRELAGEIEILKGEMEDLKQMVISLQPLLSERSRGKRVAFQDGLS
ncbi:uncharacterized protein N7473_001708 [Penicillium subrubescens]|uniref:Uncharacterized protein n=1 Tax=Penicillium subrubescens TaxID=1316194 RepID=A0A1Q5UHA4_9EURO|nr:uncharacterized protein N7473_001708 [Penicillium subrubescens]KAJ5904792.1 hypothetical protein N7473_001708 [Penicillium subrubescens]OKP11867.1 hypothetical protein PENSUB_2598 [Penicillium subrubescens]